MRAREVGAFAIGFACGALAIALALTASRKPAEPSEPRETSMRTQPLSKHEASGQADRYAEPRLSMPIAGIRPEQLADTFQDARQEGRHEALDIPAPRGTPVRAVAAGLVEKLFTSRKGGLTVYQFDASGNWCFYYAHLNGYAAGLREGEGLSTGDVFGYVGSTGDASPDAPHLHFALFRLGPEKKWWAGEAIDPLPLLK
jgi:murein DD-endopeptidase MepM/ murein hydrolase activator NlpD